jgi:hypothetical protein
MIHIKESITKKVPGITSLFVTFDYNPQIVDLIKRVDGAYYHKKEKVWECPITSLSTIIDTLCYFDDIELGVMEDTAEQPIDGYSMKSFYDSKLLEKYGTDASRRDVRRFNRYMRSDRGIADKRRFDEIERKKQEAYINAQIEKGLRARSAVAPANEAAPATPPTPPAANPIVGTPVNPKVVTPRSDAYWNDVAKQNGFKDMAQVKAWQAANGLVDDGKFGNKSRAFFDQNSWGKYEVPGGELDAVKVVAEKKAPQYYYTDNKGNRYSYTNNALTKLTAEQTKDWEHKGSIKDMDEFRNAVDFNSKTVKFGGISWANPYYLNNAFRTTNNAPD